MGKMTVDLLRRRAEHNEGCLSDLKEIALHQQDLEKIEVVGDMCRQLEILYLCNNYIGKIEGLHHLKNLQYLNLAVNNIVYIEGLDGCEMLTRLDLTLNFIGDMACIANLRANSFLETLHLTGNACTKTPGYRAFVVHTLPHLVDLDGDVIRRSEKILARQDEDEVTEVVNDESVKVREEERLKQELISKGIDPFPPKFNEKGERVYGHTPEERIQILRENEESEYQRKNRPPEPGSISAIHQELNKKPVKLTPEEEIEKYGRLLMRNEGKIPFTFEEDGETEVVVTCEPGKYISTTLINVEVEMHFIRITVKGKVLQLPLTVEVSPTLAKVERSAITGQLKLTIPLAPHILEERRQRRARFHQE
jgi:protein TilB